MKIIIIENESLKSFLISEFIELLTVKEFLNILVFTIVYVEKVIYPYYSPNVELEM